jgi:outer membrane protein
MRKTQFFKLFTKALMICLFVIPTGLFAQNKIGSVNTAAILDGMPAVAAANKKLDTLNQQYQGQMKELIDEYQKKAQEIQGPEGAKWTETIRNTKMREIQQLEERIQAFKEDANNDISKTTESLMAPIRKQISDAIKAVAKENGYSFVLDSSVGTVQYADESLDITPLVKKKLGLR